VAQKSGADVLGAFTFTWTRYLLAGLALLIFLALRAKKEGGTLRGTFAGALPAGAVMGTLLMIASNLQQYGVGMTTAGKAGFITAMYMLLVPIINFVFFRKRNTWLVWLAVLVGVAGMALLCLKAGEGFTLTKGDTLVCICAVLFAMHILCCDHFVQLGNPIAISAIQFATTSVISWVIAFLAEQPTWAKIASAAIPILYCGLMSGGLGYTLQIVAQKFTDPTIASLLMSLESVFAVLAGALLLNERMTARELLGCVVMFVAIVMVQIPLPEKKPKENA
jgi:drug/metabolite transporter (DMT)-like permease